MCTSTMYCVDMCTSTMYCVDMCTSTMYCVDIHGIHDLTSHHYHHHHQGCLSCLCLGRCCPWPRPPPHCRSRTGSPATLKCLSSAPSLSVSPPHHTQHSVRACAILPPPPLPAGAGGATHDSSSSWQSSEDEAVTGHTHSVPALSSVQRL